MIPSEYHIPHKREIFHQPFQANFYKYASNNQTEGETRKSNSQKDQLASKILKERKGSDFLQYEEGPNEKFLSKGYQNLDKMNKNNLNVENQRIFYKNDKAEVKQRNIIDQNIDLVEINQQIDLNRVNQYHEEYYQSKKCYNNDDDEEEEQCRFNDNSLCEEINDRLRQENPTQFKQREMYDHQVEVQEIEKKKNDEIENELRQLRKLRNILQQDSIKCREEIQREIEEKIKFRRLYEESEKEKFLFVEQNRELLKSNKQLIEDNRILIKREKQAAEKYQNNQSILVLQNDLFDQEDKQKQNYFFDQKENKHIPINQSKIQQYQQWSNSSNIIKDMNRQSFTDSLMNIMGSNSIQGLYHKAVDLVFYKKKTSSFINCVQEMIQKYAPSCYQGKNGDKPSLKQSWSFLKKLMERHVELKIEIEHTKQMLRQQLDKDNEGHQKNSTENQRRVNKTRLDTEVDPNNQKSTLKSTINYCIPKSIINCENSMERSSLSPLSQTQNMNEFNKSSGFHKQRNSFKERKGQYSSLTPNQCSNSISDSRLNLTVNVSDLTPPISTKRYSSSNPNNNCNNNNNRSFQFPSTYQISPNQQINQNEISQPESIFEGFSLFQQSKNLKYQDY